MIKLELTMQNLREQVGCLASYLRKNDEFETEFGLYGTYVDFFIVYKNGKKSKRTMLKLTLSNPNHVYLRFEYMEKDYFLSADALKEKAFIDSKEADPDTVWNVFQEMVDHYSIY